MTTLMAAYCSSCKIVFFIGVVCSYNAPFCSSCKVDETVMLLPTNDPATDHFKFEAFKFIGDHQFVYLHCKVKICNATDPNSRCAQGCQEHRRKRSLYTEESESEEYSLAEGPFIREENKVVMDSQETETGLRDMESSGKIMIGMAFVYSLVCAL